VLRDRILGHRRERWPPPQPISPVGRVAGLTTTGCVLATGVAWLAVTVKLALCTTGCAVEPGLAGLIAMPVAVAVIGAAALARNVLARPVEADSDAGSGWVYGLATIFALGVVAAASGIPSLTCPDGMQLSFFGFCAAPDGSRVDAASWTWLRRWIDVAGIVVGFTLFRTKRWVHVTAPIAGAVWLGGTGSLLIRTLVRG
jgi:hypothetical protein